MKIQFRSSSALALSTLVLNSVAAQPASSGSFSLVGPLSQFRKLHTATPLSSGKVLVAGGSPLAQTATSELYDPTTQTWTNAGASNLGRELHSATLLADGSVMVVQLLSTIYLCVDITAPNAGNHQDAATIRRLFRRP